VTVLCDCWLKLWKTFAWFLRSRVRSSCTLPLYVLNDTDCQIQVTHLLAKSWKSFRNSRLLRHIYRQLVVKRQAENVHVSALFHVLDTCQQVTNVCQTYQSLERGFKLKPLPSRSLHLPSAVRLCVI